MGSNQFISINIEGKPEPRYPTDTLGVVPIITTRYRDFQEMSWDDVARVSDRSVSRSGIYLVRVGETKSVELSDGSVVEAKLVGLNKEYYKSGGKVGFVFQLTNGLDIYPWSDDLPEQIYDMLPEDLQDVIVETYHKKIWLPSEANLVGPFANNWYDWYMYHNEDTYRRYTDVNGEYQGLWTSSRNSKGTVIINANGQKAYADPDVEGYLPCVCFCVSQG